MENKRYTLAEAEAQLKEISPDFTIEDKNESSDLAGIYWKGIYSEIAVPKGFIFESKNEGHVDMYGYPHRGLDSTKARAQAFLERITTDSEYLEDMTTPFDHTTIPVGDGTDDSVPELLPEN